MKKKHSSLRDQFQRSLLSIIQLEIAACLILCKKKKIITEGEGPSLTHKYSKVL